MLEIYTLTSSPLIRLHRPYIVFQDQGQSPPFGLVELGRATPEPLFMTRSSVSHWKAGNIEFHHQSLIGAVIVEAAGAKCGGQGRNS